MKRDIVKGQWLHDIALAPFTTWQIGGSAERFYWPLDRDDWAQFLTTLPTKEPITVLGLGSNTLVSDRGIVGTVIITQGVLKDLTLLPGAQVKAEAGLSCAQVARFAAKNNLISGEFLAGIPGTIGGALFMNAGAFGDETWNHVIAVETIDRQGQIKCRDHTEFKHDYRCTTGLGQDEWFVSGTFQFEPGDGQASLTKIKNLLAQRALTQPTGEPSCGSVFKNPPNHYAAQLIEQAGLKGYQIGGAQVSLKHANFIVNTGGAKAEDVLALVAHIQATVAARFGLCLHPEMKFIGQR